MEGNFNVSQSQPVLMLKSAIGEVELSARRSRNAERNAEIIRRRGAGEWPRAIARSMGLSHNVVIGVCNRAGLSGDAGRKESLRGEALPGAKLSASEVRAIRREYSRSSREHGSGALARRFGVDPKTIRLVVAGATWAHIK